MSSRPTKILLIVDGSTQSSDMVNYAGQVFSPAATEVHLLHIKNRVPDAFWDWEEDPLVPQHVDYMKDWESQKDKEMQDFMRKSLKVLTDSGFPEDRVSSKTQARQSGIARDIINETKKGYDILMVGRKGLSTLDDQMLGSVASKLISTVTDLTVCLVGGRPKPGRILVGVDASQGAWRALQLVARATGTHDPAVTLLHVLRTPNSEHLSPQSADQVSKMVEEARKALQPVFDKAVKTLTESGVNLAKIASKAATGAVSRAGALVEEARKADCGTIVVGRRGLSKVEEFSMGRVANKVSQLGANLAVWIVS